MVSIRPLIIFVDKTRSLPKRYGYVLGSKNLIGQAPDILKNLFLTS
jgi:hypothetical protein